MIADAEKIIKVLTENGGLALGELTAASLRTEVTTLRTRLTARDEARVSLTKHVDETNDQIKLVDGIKIRGRGGIKAVFGPDSPQYDQAGGTRASDRKPAKRKTTKAS